MEKIPKLEQTDSKKEKISKSRKWTDYLMIVIDVLSWIAIGYVAYLWFFKMGGCPPYDRCLRCWENITKVVYQQVGANLSIPDINLSVILPK